MAVNIKTEDEIQVMREGGKILSKIEEKVVSNVKVGVSTKELDKIAFDLCEKNKVEPAFLGYRGYPAIVSIDLGIVYKKFYVDRAVTVGVGDIAKSAEKLIKVTKECLFQGIKNAIVGNKIGDIGYAIQSTAEKGGFSVVRELVGHGIGKNLHEEPPIPGYGERGEGLELTKGMTLAIETIINEGKEEILFLEDGWTTKTKDKKVSALFEHTVVVREEEAEILTL